MQNISCAIAFLLFLFLETPLRAKYDSSFIQSKEDSFESSQPKKQKPSAKKKWDGKGNIPADDPRGGGDGPRSKGSSQTLRIKEGSKEGLDFILETIKATGHVLETIPAGAKRNITILKRASALSQLGKRNLLETPQGKRTPEITGYFQAAIRDAQQVVISKYSTDAIKNSARQIMGFAFIYLDDTKEAKRLFLQLLDNDSKFEHANWMHLFIAEELYDEGQYVEALKYYKRYLEQAKIDQKDLALYKSAWCHINLNQQKEAEAIFVRQIQSTSSQNYAQESLKDLAFILSRSRSNRDLIKAVDELFPDVARRIEFLDQLRLNIELQNDQQLHGRIIAKILELDPSQEYLRLYVSQLKITRRAYASRETWVAFEKLYSYLTKNVKDLSSKEFKDSEANLEFELQLLMKSFIDTFSGKIKAPIPIDRQKLGGSLVRQFKVYGYYFSSAAIFPSVLRVWLEICSDIQDWVCIDQASDLAYRLKQISPQDKENASLRQLAALERLSENPQSQSQSQSQSKVKKKFEDKLENYVENYPQSTSWPKIARKFAQTELEQKNFKKAIQIYDRLFMREKTAASFVSLQRARFDGKEFEALFNDVRETPFGREPQIHEIKREAALALAIEAKAQRDIVQYRKYIQVFMKLKPEPEKARIAQMDLLGTLFENQMFSETTEELQRSPASFRYSTGVRELLTKVWLKNIEMGSVAVLPELLENERTQKSPAWVHYLSLMTKFIRGERLNISGLGDLSLVTPQQQEAILNYLALTQPALVLGFLEVLPQLSESHRRIAELALRVEGGKWQISKTSQSLFLLGKGYARFSPEPAEILPVESRISKLQFPIGKISEKKFERDAKFIVDEARRIRRKVVNEIKGRAAETQLRVLTKASDFEKRVARLILDSPLPKTSDTVQLESYKAGIETLAKEFQDQSNEFNQALQTLTESLQKSQEELEKNSLLKPPRTQWKWPSAFQKDSLVLVRTLIAQNNITGALIVLDLLRKQVALSDGDYFRMRTGILLYSRESLPLRLYLAMELETNRQKEIIEECIAWAK